MENLSDALLIEAYYKTKEFNLESDFTKLIIDELKSRTIHFID
ncbi:sporulation histidine kinase inhibitor Sda [Virgibacillus phasianinus]|nr:sporulation histidine kinase inhibitor Sda [Virgibacillus phasianinus]